MLIDAGADVNAQGGSYGNALQAASGEGHKKVVKMLIDAGAEVKARGGEYSNALLAALYGGHEKVVEMLIENGACGHTLHPGLPRNPS
jgi:ankyrin repeat protein